MNFLLLKLSFMSELFVNSNSITNMVREHTFSYSPLSASQILQILLYDPPRTISNHYCLYSHQIRLFLLKSVHLASFGSSNWTVLPQIYVPYDQWFFPILLISSWLLLPRTSVFYSTSDSLCCSGTSFHCPNTETYNIANPV